MNKNTLESALQKLAAPMALGESLPERKVRCVACGHRCLIPEGRAGVCKVRFNRGGTLFGPRGYVAGLQDDPIEKKPFYHALPGTRALSFGMMGCDFHCGYCQNWITSQALRDEQAGVRIQPVSAEEIVVRAKDRGALTLTSTYNEPLITSEWAMEIFEMARNGGLFTSYVSNGNATDEVVDFIRGRVDFYKIDLKGFDDRRYRKLGGTLQQILDGIERVYRAGIWLEIVTLVVPGFNDSDEELRGIAGFIADLSADIPWHVTAFHPDYRMKTTGGTSAATLLRAYGFGKSAGLHHVYAGNLPGRVQQTENTYCPHCEALLIERLGFTIRQYRLRDHNCPQCEAPVAGFWHTQETRRHMEFARSSRVQRVSL